MFVSDRIVFLELEKTGCSHILKLLGELDDGKIIAKHNQADRKCFTGQRLFFGSVRDPWEWHISLWAFGCSQKGELFKYATTPGIKVRGRGWKMYPLSALLEITQCRPNRHAAEWKRTYRDANDAGAFRQWLHMLHDHVYSPGIGLPYGQLPMSQHAGFLTYKYLRLFTCKRGELRKLEVLATHEDLVEYDRRNCFIDHFVRNERLESDLLAGLKLANFEVPEAMASGMSARPRTNTSKRRTADYYYDADTERLVSQRDKFIVEKFGYVAPSAR